MFLNDRFATAVPPRRFDVCNGDADGLCAVLQWRLQEPLPAMLVTGLKREIALLHWVDGRPGDEVLVCDLSLPRNRSALIRLLIQGAAVRYFDHHRVDGIPSHPRFEAHFDTGPGMCTSLLMDKRLGGAFAAWALVGAYGDNLATVADEIAVNRGFGLNERACLRQLGETINYNAYGEDEGDVRIAPAHLYGLMSRYRDPLMMSAREPIVRELDAWRRNDLRRAMEIAPVRQDARASVRVLPNAPWARRVVGTLANEVAQARPDRAHAVMLCTRDGYRVSVRAPLSAPGGAGELCRMFGGGGRAAAAGIDELPGDQRNRFIDMFVHARWQEPAAQADG